MIVVLLVVLVMLAFNALYVAAEFAAVSVRRSQIRQLAEEGHAGAKALLPIVDNAHHLDAFVATSQVGITITSLVLGAYGQSNLAPLIEPYIGGLAGEAAAASVAAIGVLTVLTVTQVVMAELVPKSLALQFPKRTALLLLRPMQWSSALFKPLIIILNGSATIILKLFGQGGEGGGHRHIHAPEEIELLIAESSDGGLLESGEQVRLQRALRLGKMTVRDVMVPAVDVAMIDADTPSDQALTEVVESPFTRLPVYQGDRDTVIGTLHTQDVVRAVAQGQEDLSVAELARPLMTVPELVTVERLLALMREKRSRHALVVDEYGQVAGLVAVEDLLAEVLGGVADERKETAGRPVTLPDGRVRLPGRWPTRRLSNWLGKDWNGSARTVAGKVMEAAGGLPTEGTTVVVEDVSVEIEAVEGQAVVSVVATPPEPDPPEEDGASKAAAPADGEDDQ